MYMALWLWLNNGYFPLLPFPLRSSVKAKRKARFDKEKKVYVYFPSSQFAGRQHAESSQVCYSFWTLFSIRASRSSLGKSGETNPGASIFILKSDPASSGGFLPILADVTKSSFESTPPNATDVILSASGKSIVRRTSPEQGSNSITCRQTEEGQTDSWENDN